MMRSTVNNVASARAAGAGSAGAVLAPMRDAGVRGVDPMLAGIFRGMRAALGMTSAELARRIATAPAVIASLEAGYIGALPPWPETERLIIALGRLVDADVRPILARMQQHLGSTSVTVAQVSPPFGPALYRVAARPQTAIASRPASSAVSRPPAAQRSTSAVSAPPAATSRTAAVESTGKVGLGAPVSFWLRCRGMLKSRWVKAAVAALCSILIAGVALTAVPSGASSLRATIDQLPPGLVRSVRGGFERMLQRTSAGSDGLKHVDVWDPKSRKADRLPVAGVRN